MYNNLPEFLTINSSLDRRQKKTHLAIETALLELLQDKSLETISIKELTEKADVNRKTFYNNYSSIEDVMEEINEKIFTYAFDNLPETITINNEIEIYHLLLRYTTAIEPHKSILRRAIRRMENMAILEQFKEQILPYIEKNLLNYQIEPALIPYINSYIVNGLSCIFYEWINDDKLTAEQVALLGYNLTVSAIKLDNYKDIKCM